MAREHTGAANVSIASRPAVPDLPETGATLVDVAPVNLKTANSRP